MSNYDLPRTPDLPEWMKLLRDRYLRTDTGQFILHGNVHDLIFCAGRAWSMPEFLETFFKPSGKLVVHYDPSAGIRFPADNEAARAAKALIQTGMLPSAQLAPRGLERSSETMLASRLRDQLDTVRGAELALEILESLLRSSEPVALIIHYAELIAPDGSSSALSFEDRNAAARLHRWSLAREIVGRDNLVLMLSSALPDLSRRVSRNPRVGSISVGLPQLLERARFLAHLDSSLDPKRGEQLSRVTAGLQLRQIDDLISPQLKERVGAQTPMKLPLEAINQRKKEILEQECAGLIEVVTPDHGFENVGGLEPIKAALQRVAEHFKAGRRAQVPMGILFVGPMGTGKSFLAEAFAHSSGLACIRLKNFRDKWVGSTEANLEKVLSVIEGLGEILVLIDEGDRSLGGGDQDGGVNSRVMARLKEFMSDPSHRGRIIFVMMTNRPDKLDVDMKRPGRFDLKIPFFSPQDAEERAGVVRAVLRRHSIKAALPDEELLPILRDLRGFAAADLEALVLLAYDDLQSGLYPKDPASPADHLSPAFLERAIQDFMPSRDLAMIRYMELLAVHEASNRRLLPEEWREIEVETLNEQLSSARLQLQRRAAPLS